MPLPFLVTIWLSPPLQQFVQLSKLFCRQIPPIFTEPRRYQTIDFRCPAIVRHRQQPDNWDRPNGEAAGISVPQNKCKRVAASSISSQPRGSTSARLQKLQRVSESRERETWESSTLNRSVGSTRSKRPSNWMLLCDWQEIQTHVATQSRRVTAKRQHDPVDAGTNALKHGLIESNGLGTVDKVPEGLPQHCLFREMRRPCFVLTSNHRHPIVRGC